MTTKQLRTIAFRGTLVLAFLLVTALPARADGPDLFLKQSRPAGNPPDIDEWRNGEQRGGLAPYPAASPGMPNPPGALRQYGGGGQTSFAPPTLGMPFREWKAKMEQQRPEINRTARGVLEERFDLGCRSDPAVTMSRGKVQPLGPAAKLPDGIASWEAYAALDPDEIKKTRFPYVPLDHPLQSTAHMVFPNMWTRVHPEHERFDVGFDLPDCFLPEFPPPLYLTTHRELGDVSRGWKSTTATTSI